MAEPQSHFHAPLLNETQAKFVWYGDRQPRLLGDFNDWDTNQAFELRQVKTGKWSLTIDFPAQAYVEYTYLLDGERVLDPHNPRLVSNGLHEVNNFFYMPGAAPTPLVQPYRGEYHGRLSRFDLPTEWTVMGSKRSVFLYQPAAEQPAPLLVVLDGQDYRRHARLVNLVDNLFAQGRISPLGLAMVSNGNSARGVEYYCNDATVEFVVQQVIPLAQAHLNLVDTHAFPGSYGVLGASLGGLMAVYLAVRAPQIFGRVLSQSGAFFADSVLNDLLLLKDRLPLRIWMDVGLLESLLDDNRRMRALLASRGYEVLYREFPGGHNYTAWRDDLWRGLEALFR